MSAWEYFRKEAKPGEAPEIFTDPESKIQKYQRILRFLIIFFPVLFILFSTSGRQITERGPMGGVLLCITTGILVLYAVGSLGIILRIGRLKKTVRK